MPSVFGSGRGGWLISALVWFAAFDFPAACLNTMSNSFGPYAR